MLPSVTAVFTTLHFISTQISTFADQPNAFFLFIHQQLYNSSWLFDNLTMFTDSIFDVSVSAILKSKRIPLIFPIFLERGCHMVVKPYRE